MDVVEGLCGLVREAEAKGLLLEVPIGKGNLRISLLEFTDDTIFFTRKSMIDIITLKTILGCFEMASGLKLISSRVAFWEFMWSTWKSSPMQEF